MTRSAFVLSITVAASMVTVLGERHASACGGCFHPPTQTASDITDERMLLSVSPTQTTLYDQIIYAGSPSSFAWVLPIHGTVTVGLSADVLFDSIDLLTATQITPPPSSCAPNPCARNFAFAGGAAAGASDASVSALPEVTVLKQQNVGPYATVQLHATDSSALNTWLAQNGFAIPAASAQVIGAYVTEGFDFLAMKLLPDQGVQAMRPVRVTSTGASLSLPLRMASVGTGAKVGITIWVVSDGRYEPQNFPFFHIDDSALVWDWSTNLSNYTSLRDQNEKAANYGAWEIESSLTLSQQLITNVILSGGHYYGNGFGFGFGGGFNSAPPADPSLDYVPVGNPDAGADSGAFETAEEVRTDDVNALFAGIAAPNARITRVRADIAQAKMTTDLVFQASATDQSEISNIRYVTHGINEVCPVYSACGSSSGTSAGSTPSASTASGAGSSSGAVSSSGPVSTSGSGSSSGAVVASADGGASPSPISDTPSPSHGTRWGCGASAPANAGASAAFAALLAMIALAWGRARTRRRAARKE